MTDQLFPRQPRRMRQPPKELLRQQLAQAASEIERLRAPWWRRIILSRRRAPKDIA